MRLRLFFILILLVLTMVFGFLVLLLLTGMFPTGVKASEKLIQNMLFHTQRDISAQYGQLSVQAVEFSKNLSPSIVKYLEEKELKLTNLQNHPEIIEELLAGQYERAMFALQRSKSSGVFIILDTTVNPKLKNAEFSRAGLYIKNMEPNILSASSPTILLLRGFPDIGRKNSISLHAQWRMEFDISDAPYYALPMEQAAKSGGTLPLSRLYYWSPALIIPGTSEKVMLCSVPLLDAEGKAFGVCGFEISSMLFKLAHMPDNSIYSRLFCMFAPISGNTLDTSGAMLSGGYSARHILTNHQMLYVNEKEKSFSWYSDHNENSFAGFHLPVELYPRDSVFYDQKWAALLMLPAEDIKYAVTGSNIRLSLMFIFLMILGGIISFVLSKHYTRPISEGLDIIKSSAMNEAPKTNIPEIDDLIEFLSAHGKAVPAKGELSEALNEFSQKVHTLSPAERSVFDLYVQQYTAKEISKVLCLSINTIKTHSKRIYAKLGVSSREELLVYINMLKEAGKEFK